MSTRPCPLLRWIHTLAASSVDSSTQPVPTLCAQDAAERVPGARDISIASSESAQFFGTVLHEGLRYWPGVLILRGSGVRLADVRGTEVHVGVVFHPFFIQLRQGMCFDLEDVGAAVQKRCTGPWGDDVQGPVMRPAQRRKNPSEELRIWAGQEEHSSDESFASPRGSCGLVDST